MANTRSADFERDNSEYLDVAATGDLDWNGAQDFTIRWFENMETHLGSERIFSRWGGSDNNFLIRTLTATVLGRVYLNTSSDGTNSNEDFVELSDSWENLAGSWVELVLTFDASAGTAEVWEDGVSAGTMSGLHTSLNNSANAFTVGADPGGGDHYDGLLDDVVVFNRILTDAEIGDITGCTFDNKITGATAYWKMDEASGSRSDSSANSFTLSDNNTVGSSTTVATSASCVVSHVRTPTTNSTGSFLTA